MIDLHSHSTASDGSLTPRELVERASKQGVNALAITDHDTLDGLEEAIQAGRDYNVEIVPGLEISAEFPVGTMHILGYYISRQDQQLLDNLAMLRNGRDERNPKIVTKLRELGLDITLEEVERVAGGDVVGRPHFARVLIDKGYVQSANEAFERFLAKGAPAYMEKVRLEPHLAIETIHRAGGVAVLAHPYQLRSKSADELDKVIASLKEMGLDGMEVIYSRHTANQVEEYHNLARRYSLLVTGGSDFHGVTKPDIEVGIGLGSLSVPPELLDHVKSCAARHHQHFLGENS